MNNYVQCLISLAYIFIKVIYLKRNQMEEILIQLINNTVESLYNEYYISKYIYIYIYIYTYIYVCV